jgi:hypothetical protein
MPYTPPATSDINFTVASFTPPVTSDINFNLDPVGAPSFSIIIANAAQAQTADNVTITAHNPAVTIASATQAVTADNVTMTTKWALTIASAAQAVTADNVTMTFTPGAAPATPSGAARGINERARWEREMLRKRLEEEDEEILAVMYA